MYTQSHAHFNIIFIDTENLNKKIKQFREFIN